MLQDNIGSNDKKILIDKMVKNLKQLRANRNITQEELANIIGVSRQTINAIESGKREMNWMMFIVIVLFFSRDDETRSLMTFMGIYTKQLALFLNSDFEQS